MSTNQKGREVRVTSRWVSDAEGDGGTLTLWPDTDAELELTLGNFLSAHKLCNAISHAEKAAFERGRDSLFRRIEGLR